MYSTPLVNGNPLLSSYSAGASGSSTIEVLLKFSLSSSSINVHSPSEGCPSVTAVAYLQVSLLEALKKWHSTCTATTTIINTNDSTATTSKTSKNKLLSAAAANASCSANRCGIDLVDKSSQLRSLTEKNRVIQIYWACPHSFQFLLTGKVLRARCIPCFDVFFSSTSSSTTVQFLTLFIISVNYGTVYVSYNRVTGHNFFSVAESTYTFNVMYVTAGPVCTGLRPLGVSSKWSIHNAWLFFKFTTSRSTTC